MFINSFIDCVPKEQHTSFILPPLFLIKKEQEGTFLKAREGESSAFSTLKFKDGKTETKRLESKEFLRKRIVIL